ncbi:PLP-dependent aminotransferase family protein [Bremerella cremea]|uniref:aminotransferase-like domain-containing protein n=1 Tax=Bremerella cremea TaxID=1031537 RepID=UPI0031F14A29
MRRTDWVPRIDAPDLPLFEAIAKSIADDIAAGKLLPGDHLPTQRQLAKRLDLDVTTIARGYSTAASRGHIESRVGAGTFVRGAAISSESIPVRADVADRTMNQPPDVEPDLVESMKRSAAEAMHAFPQVLRYQPEGGDVRDKGAAIHWLSRRGIAVESQTLHITTGAHAALTAVLSAELAEGGAIASEQVTYPGLFGIARLLRCPVHGIPSDRDGILPDALAEAIETKDVRVLYLNPTLHNPTTDTMPLNRRLEIVEVARQFGIPIVEDDAYGFLPIQPPPAIVMLAPDCTYYVGGLAKCLGPGLRIAYLLVPPQTDRQEVTERLRAVSVMASPITTAIVTHWIESGLADKIVVGVRNETRQRIQLLKQTIPGRFRKTNDFCFHAWIETPRRVPVKTLVDMLRGYSIGAVPANEFCTEEVAPSAFRFCVGGPVSFATLQQAMESIRPYYES